MTINVFVMQEIPYISILLKVNCANYYKDRLLIKYAHRISYNLLFLTLIANINQNKYKKTLDGHGCKLSVKCP